MSSRSCLVSDGKSRNFQSIRSRLKSTLGSWLKLGTPFWSCVTSKTDTLKIVSFGDAVARTDSCSLYSSVIGLLNGMSLLALGPSRAFCGIENLALGRAVLQKEQKIGPLAETP